MQVYAYTSSALQAAILRLFVRCECVLPNLFVGVLTRESITGALGCGLTADQIVAFLRKHAHPHVAQRVPVVPEARPLYMAGLLVGVRVTRSLASMHTRMWRSACQSCPRRALNLWQHYSSGFWVPVSAASTLRRACQLCPMLAIGAGVQGNAAGCTATRVPQHPYDDGLYALGPAT